MGKKQAENSFEANLSKVNNADYPIRIKIRFR